VRPELASSSTDSNVAISLGIPAVTVGVGGESGGIHTTEEWYSNEGGADGLERALLLVLAAANQQRRL
jgi:tripeptide aminopeptidase